MRRVRGKATVRARSAQSSVSAAAAGAVMFAAGSLVMASADMTGDLTWTKAVDASMDAQAGAVRGGGNNVQSYVFGNVAGNGTLNTVNAGPSVNGIYTWAGNYAEFSASSAGYVAPSPAPTFLSVPPGTFDIASASSYWSIAFQGANNDYFMDQQTGQAASDLVGDATHPVLYRYYDPSTTYGDHTHGMLFFRARIGGKNSTGSAWGPFDNVLSIGLDFNTLTSPFGKMDMFVMLDVHNPTGQIGVALAGAGANTSPDTTTVGNFLAGTTADVVRNTNSAVYNFQYVGAADGPVDLESNGATDGWVSFGLPFNYVVSAANQMGLSITDATPIHWGFGTSTQPNSFNQDVNGTLNRTDPWTTIYNGTDPTPVGSDVYHPAIAATIVPNPIDLGKIHAGGTFGTRTLTLGNTATDDGFAEKLNGSVGSTTGNATGTGSVALLPAGGTDSTGITVGLDGASTGGRKTGTVTVNLSSDGTGTSGKGQTALTPQTVTVTGDVYNYAAADAASKNINLGRVHAGGAFTAQNVPLTNTAPDDGYSESLDAAISPAGLNVSATGSFALLGPGQTNSTSLNVNLTDTTTAGSKTGTATIALTSNGTGTSGLGNTTLAPVTVNISGSVYSGLSTWGAAASSGWNNFSNWDTLGGVPGIDGALSRGHDTATFSNSGLAQNTVNLNGASPEIRTLSLTATSGSYTIAQGTGGSIQMTGVGAAINAAGIQTISAPVQLTTATQVNVNGVADRLTIAGQLQGIGDLTKTGLGALVLTNTNSATGSIIIGEGSLRLAGGASVAGDVTVNNGAWLQGSGTVNLTLRLNDGGGVSPGGDIGIGALTIAASPSAGTSHLAGGEYRFEVSQLTSSPGSQDSLRGTGFDTINVHGPVVVDATTTNRFTVDVRSLTLDQSAQGALSGWDPSSGYRWTLVQADGGVVGFDPAAFTIDTSAFYNENPYLLGGNFQVELSADQKSIALVYAVPEPGILLTLSSVVIGGCWLRPRRRVEKEPKLLDWRGDEAKQPEL